jgi:hypothetical protein
MQKVQLYLVTNRIRVVADRTGSYLEYKQVYQKKIKLYKGATNTIEFDMRNSEQRRIDINGKTLLVSFYDSEHQMLFQGRALPASNKHGIFILEVTDSETEMLEPQMLRASALLESQSGTQMVYSDDQHGLLFEVELLDGYNDRGAETEVIDTINLFNYEYDRKTFVSEIGIFGNKVNSDHSSRPVSAITVDLQGTYSGVVTVEATSTMSTAFGVKWIKLPDWDLSQESQKTYSGEYRFVRFSYPKYTDQNYTTLTGTIDRVYIRN